MQKITKFLIDLVKQSSLFINKNKTIHKKDDQGDLVTDFDYAIEKFMIEKMKEEYPTYDVISEEFNPHADAQENYFLIDPIDGTVNFANNIPLWGIQVAAAEKSKINSAVIYLPDLNELYYADKTGAYLNNKKIVIKENQANKKLFGLLQGHQIKFIENTRHYRYIGCSCVSYSWLIKQCVCGILFSCENIAKNWDAAPGVYIAQQAGCVLKNNGTTYAIADNEKTAKDMLKAAK